MGDKVGSPSPPKLQFLLLLPSIEDFTLVIDDINRDIMVECEESKDAGVIELRRLSSTGGLEDADVEKVVYALESRLLLLFG